MPKTHALRRERLATVLAERDIDAALITRLVNVRYLTGLASSNAALLVGAGGWGVLATDGRYAHLASIECPELELVNIRQTAPALVERAAQRGVRRLAFEAHEVTVEQHTRLTDAARGVEFVTLGHAVEELRTVKDGDEIAALARACAISDAAFADLLPTLGPGMSEREVAVRLERLMVDHGAQGLAFDTIVASGPAGAMPHHEPDQRVLERGDLVTIDFGALVGGYHADMTRTVALGAVGGWQHEIYELVAHAQRLGREALRPGADVRDVDSVARDVIKQAGYEEYFPHGLGHGVGLEVHESPMIGYSATGKLADHAPVTVEPGIYLPGRGGVRIEDTLVVRDQGPELLTKTTKELLVL